MSEIAPPSELKALATWFAEAVQAEVSELEKKGREQRYELHSGQRITPENSPFTIYRFLLADNTLVPEDASAVLDVAGRLYNATIVSQSSGWLEVQVVTDSMLGQFVPRALLRVDDLGLLRKLIETLESLALGAEPVSPLMISMFHPNPNGVCKLPLSDIPALDGVEDEKRGVLEQACASEITYIWGPPGTGKTFVIARLIAILVERGERVLMTSHTHAAVDQAIYETVKRGQADGSGKPGPLADTDWERQGEIVRIGGPITNSKVPDSVRLDRIVERKAQAIQTEITKLMGRAAPFSSKRTQLNSQLAEWARLNELKQRLVDRERRMNESASLAAQEMKDEDKARTRIDQCKELVVKANKAWFFRASKVRQAVSSVDAAEAALEIASKNTTEAVASVRQIERTVETIRVAINTQAGNCAGLLPVETLNRELVPIETELGIIDHSLSELKARLDSLEKEIIGEARVVAATLTKCYVGNQLDGETFDVLIADEVSMALPPLLFVAARRAFRRVILVGDFKQLPPIVRSENGITDERLSKDVFHLAGIATDQEEPTDHPALTSLRTQHRMLPAIADAARFISYKNGLLDHEEVLHRKQPDWLGFLRDNALLIVDTADLHCWCGRQAGSLSRFNFYSAQIAMELAAMAAAGIPQPDADVEPPIGIVTPYAAQRRLLSRLVNSLELRAWVQVGTVHTFQGGQAELIIFDCVLDEPYWTARLCNPRQRKDVRRDLNVALTRARSKFIFLGSSEWLNRHAQVSSGLGELWHYMKDHADLESALDIVELGFAGRVASTSAACYIPQGTGTPKHEILDETKFYDIFSADLREAKESIFGLVPFFGSYRWPTIEPLIRQALERGVEVTFVTPLPSEAENKTYVESVIRTLRQLGAIIVAATGLHGKDIIIDSRIHYTGSLNWASHRGRAEIMHRTVDSDYARTVLDYLQARHIRAAVGQGAQPRTCPQGHPIHIVNQAQTMRPWDKQPIKVGCADYKDTGCKYLVDIDQRPPFIEPPLCNVDGRTKYRRVKRRRGEVWECPKHPRDCERFKVVLGDP
ncbi:MAG: AAA domain-containing protein [candidate division Zixibacteria bacterium]|nr:AAA domain-containing protein [candidate division Zixibacteria bacterium]